jgi:glycine cleavage system H lipoate-binding protein
MIADTGPVEAEKCSSAAFVQCRVFQAAGSCSQGEQCPFLDHTLAEYCSAAPIPKLVAANGPVNNRCADSRHRYCQVYLRLTEPSHEIPGGARFSANHMWLEVADDGICHVGVDGFLAGVLGTVDRVSFVTVAGVDRPSAVLTAAGVDLHVVFPNPMRITGINIHLKADASAITASPYRSGWLFEGRGAEHNATWAGLLEAARAIEWMGAERERLSLALREIAAADGGEMHPNFAKHLDREQLLRLFNDFFSPHASWTRHS